MDSIVNTGVSAINGAARMIMGAGSMEGFVTQGQGVVNVPTNSAVAVVNKLAEGFLGKSGEPFVTQTDGNVQVNSGAAAKLGVFAMLSSLLVFIFLMITSYGAARLSYCYNISVGNTTDAAFLFSILCFFFPSFYYPYYALVLNPLCMKGRNNRGMMGGKK